MSSQNDQSGKPGPADSHQNRSPRNRKILIPVLIIIAVLITVFWLYLNNKRHFVSTDDAVIEADRVAVSAEMPGRISQLLADEGDSVQAGQILVRIDDSDLLARKNQAGAALNLSMQNIKLAEVSLQKSKLDYDRAATQYKEHVISKEQFDHANSEYEAALAKKGITEAQKEAAAAQLRIVETQLEHTVISSPLRGVVSKRWVLPGDVVQPAQAIMTLYDLNHVWVTANVEETKIGLLRKGDPVSIKVDAYPESHFQGTIIRIGSNTAAQFSLIPPNNAAGNFTKITQRVPVEISIDTDDSVRLLPGMSVSIKVKVR